MPETKRLLLAVVHATAFFLGSAWAIAAHVLAQLVKGATLYFPAVQPPHVPPLELFDWPAAQTAQAVNGGTLDWPAGHTLHVLLYFPAVQAAQALPSALYLPEPHAEQPVNGGLLDWPAGHTLHVLLPTSFANLPGAQAAHALPSALYLPEPHAEQPVCASLGPVTAEPAGHAVHPRFCFVAQA